MTRRWCGLFAFFLLLGCDNSPTDPEPLTARVVVMALESGQRIAGVKVVALDPNTNSVLAGPLLTDADGLADFGIAPQPEIHYLVMAGLQWQMHKQDTWSWSLDKNDKNSPLPVYFGRRVIVLRPATPQDGLPRLAGRIVDADTGLPLAQTFVGTSPRPTAYNYESDPGDDVTGADGQFVAQEIAVAAHPVTGNLQQLDIMFISRAGYRPRSWVYEWANGDNNLDVTGLEIALTPLAESDRGELTGRILLRGEPVAHVQVGIGGFVADKAGVGLPGQATFTDADGRYRFTNLATGTYVVQPGYALFDGVFFPNQAGAAAVAVAHDQTSEVVDLEVLQEITPWLPDRPFRRAEGSLRLEWSPVTDAATYEISLDGTEFAATPDSIYMWPIGGEMPDGWHYIRVQALSETGELLGLMQRESWFQLVE